LSDLNAIDMGVGNLGKEKTKGRKKGMRGGHSEKGGMIPEESNEKKE